MASESASMERTATSWSSRSAPSQEAELVGVGVDDAVARGAVPAGLQARAARAVGRPAAGVRADAIGTPLAEEAQGPGQLVAGGRQLVRVPGRPGRVRTGDDD